MVQGHASTDMRRHDLQPVGSWCWTQVHASVCRFDGRLSSWPACKLPHCWGREPVGWCLDGRTRRDGTLLLAQIVVLTGQWSVPAWLAHTTEVPSTHCAQPLVQLHCKRRQLCCGSLKLPLFGKKLLSLLPQMTAGSYVVFSVSASAETD